MLERSQPMLAKDLPTAGSGQVASSSILMQNQADVNGHGTAPWLLIVLILG
jgi:hypothetical protein